MLRLQPHLPSLRSSVSPCSFRPLRAWNTSKRLPWEGFQTRHRDGNPEGFSKLSRALASAGRRGDSRIARTRLRSARLPLLADTGPVVFVLTEFQIVDVRTSEANEQGENSHERYKERQATRVRARLMHGMQDDDSGGPTLDLTGRQDGDLGHD